MFDLILSYPGSKRQVILAIRLSPGPMKEGFQTSLFTTPPLVLQGQFSP